MEYSLFILVVVHYLTLRECHTHTLFFSKNPPYPKTDSFSGVIKAKKPNFNFHIMWTTTLSVIYHDPFLKIF